MIITLAYCWVRLGALITMQTISNTRHARWPHPAALVPLENPCTEKTMVAMSRLQSQHACARTQPHQGSLPLAAAGVCVCVFVCVFPRFLVGRLTPGHKNAEKLTRNEGWQMFAMYQTQFLLLRPFSKNRVAHGSQCDLTNENLAKTVSK